MTSSPYNVLVIFCFVLSFVKGNDRHMICKEVHDVFADRSPSTGTRMAQRGMHGKAGPRGPPGLKGEPGIVEPELLRERIAEEVNSAVQERFARYDAKFNELNSKLLQMERKLNETETAIRKVQDCWSRQLLWGVDSFSYKNKCYWLALQIKGGAQFSDAQSLCSKDGGEPGDVLDQRHYDMIKGLFWSHYNSTRHFWTGMKFNPSTKVTNNSDGSRSNFQKWYSSSYPSSILQNTGILIQIGGAKTDNNGMYNRLQSNTAYGALCQS